MPTLAVLTALTPVCLAAELPRPRITGVAHMALFVEDMEKSRAFYKDFLGYGEVFSLNNPDGSLSMIFIKVNDRQYVELFPQKAGGTDRLNHISVEVEDAEAMRKYLESRGVAVPAQVPKGRIGNSNFNVKDPDGHTVEFVQYEPAGWTKRDEGKAIGAKRISTRMMHLGILVGDLDASMKFYRDILGFREFWRGGRDEKVLNWVNMRVPDGDDYIEFMLYENLPEPTKRGSQHHICLEVPDMDKALADLESRPARKNYPRTLEIRTGVNRRRQMNIFDPDGTRVEVMEPRTVDGVPAKSSQAPPPRRAPK